jgi:hypothetical protein
MRKIQEEYSSDYFLNKHKHLQDDIIELRKLISKGNRSKIKQKLYDISKKLDIMTNKISYLVQDDIELKLNALKFTPKKLFVDIKTNSVIVIR